MNQELDLRKVARFAVIALFALIAIFSTFYTVSEGHVGVVKRFGKAIDQSGPGFHVKIMFIDSVTDFDVRQRKTVESLQAATQDQLPITAEVSINWTVDRPAVIDMYRQYGDLAQFEGRILDPKLRSATKAALSRFPANELIKERQTVVAEIMETMTQELEGFPIEVNSPQLENITLPERYVEAVEQKETAREGAEKEKHVLEQQRLQALQAVNSAQADAEAKKLAADAEAYRVITEAKSEAEAIELINKQLAKSPRYVDFVVAKTWDGKLPNIMMGEGAVPLLQLPK